MRSAKALFNLRGTYYEQVCDQGGHVSTHSSPFSIGQQHLLQPFPRSTQLHPVLAAAFTEGGVPRPINSARRRNASEASILKRILFSFEESASHGLVGPCVQNFQ